MRIRAITIIFIWLICATPYAQTKTYSFEFQGVPLHEVIAAIAKVTGYEFSYVSEVLPDRNLSGRWQNITLETFLDEILYDEILSFDIEDNNVIIYANRNLTSPFRVFGRLSDAVSGEVLTGANIYTNAFQGVISDNYGLYSIRLDPKRDSLLIVSFIGYTSLKYEVAALASGRKDLNLNLENDTLVAVTITNETPKQRMAIPEDNILQSETYQTGKSISGDQDIMEFLTVVPGVTKMSEGRTGFSVHGSATDQNLILIDEAPVFNPSHALGFLSVFNHDALNSVNFYKNSISSRYGGRLSSVLDIRMREGNNKSLAASLTSNPFYSGLTVEGPIIQDKASFLISGRMSHMNGILNQFDPIDGYYIPEKITFYDVHAKINYTLGRNNRLYFSSFVNNDEIEPYKESDALLFYDTNWQNRTFTGRWNSIWNDKLFTNLSVVFSDYEYNKESDALNNRLQYQERSEIANSHLKLDVHYHASKSHKLLAGFNGTNYTFNPASGSISVPAASFSIQYDIESLKSRELAVFLEDDIKIGRYANVHLGLRYSQFQDIGNDTYEYTFDDNGDAVDSVFRSNNTIVRTFDNFEPRVSADYQVHERWLLRGSWSRTSQYIIRLLNSNPTAPNEYWIPAGLNIAPLTATSYSLTVHGELNKYARFSLGYFNQKSKNVTAFKTGANLFFSESLIDRQVTQGDFESSGIEFSLEKKKDAYRYFISYTYSNAEVKFDEINAGNYFNASNNYTHDFNAQGAYSISKKVLLTLNWQMRSGDLITTPSGVGFIGGIPFPIHTERNNFRSNAYNRMDIAGQVNLIEKARFNLNMTLGVYNVTGSRNAFQTKFLPDERGPKAETLALYRTVPFLHLKFVYK